MKITEITRQALLDHATDVFAENGFERASVREITGRATANQAAINYHFGGKEALYREVLRLAIGALNEASLLDEDTIDSVSRDEAVRLFIRQQVTPLLKHGQIGRYLRIFAWETLAPTPVYRDFITSEKLPMLDQAEKIVRRFLPPAAARADITIATIWLTQQVTPFIRHYETLSKPPLSLKIDKNFIERLAADLGRMTVAGLSVRSTHHQHCAIGTRLRTIPMLEPDEAKRRRHKRCPWPRRGWRRSYVSNDPRQMETARGGNGAVNEWPREIDQAYKLKSGRCRRPCKVFGLDRTKVFHVKHFGTIGAAGI